jgi:hypothetical protein
VFGAAIIEMRRQWGITNCSSDYPRDNDEIVIYTPGEWPESVPSSPFPPTDIDEQAGLLIVPPEVSDGGPMLIAWYRDLKRLHDLSIPESSRAYEPFPETSWITFLSKCIVFEPARPRLLEFSDRAIVRIDVPMANLTDPPEDRCIVNERYAMVGAPIETVTDVRHVEHAWITFYEEVFSLVSDALQNEHGIDLRALRENVTEKHPEVWSRQRERLSSAGKRLVIHVERDTTEEEVTGALKILKAGLQEEPRLGRPRRDPLVCVQCAIWRDEEGWSHVQIAERFNWAIQYPPAQIPRSETARQHIAEGRRILNQRHKKSAP